jgi:ferric-dicitrate binding protein FerR (iron transport regulator)
MNATRFKSLMDRYIAGSATRAEYEELSLLVKSGEYDDTLKQVIADIYEAEDGSTDLPATKRQELLLQIFATETEAPSARRIPMFTWWAAAAVLLLAGIGWLIAQRSPATVTPPPAIASTTPVKNDILPGSNKATLTLSDGSVITLDSTGKQVISENGTAIRRQNGELQYSNTRTGNTPTYNILATPKGGQYRLLLPDGTAVWLNAASSIRYPVAFTGSERKVELTGEAYFEVAQDAHKPFRIAVNKEVIEVLGTHFNVHAYTEEAAITTSLLEGAVKVGKRVLKPGEQALLTQNGNITVTTPANIAEAVAWKDGFFVFRKANLPTVMRELARWYDVTVIYQPNVNNEQQFSGRIDRNLTLSEVLSGLALTNARFRIEENRKVVILP